MNEFFSPTMEIGMHTSQTVMPIYIYKMSPCDRLSIRLRIYIMVSMWQTEHRSIGIFKLQYL